MNFEVETTQMFVTAFIWYRNIHNSVHLGALMPRPSVYSF